MRHHGADMLGPTPGDGVVLVAGEALFDLVVESDDALHGHPGGGPFNAARTLGRLGAPVAYLGRLSSDRFGRTLERMLLDDGVLADGIVRTDDPTTLALAELDSGGSARWSFYERGTSAPGLTPEMAVAALPASVDIVHVGTLGLVLEPMATALEAVVESLSSTALIAVDPNCRPSAISDAVGYRSRLRRVLAQSHLVKVSDEDLEWLDPGAAPLDAARRMLDAGPSVVLVTRGGEGAVVVGPDGDIPVPAPAIEVVDTIGAGDAFGAGFLAWWRSHGLGAGMLRDTDRVVDATRFAVLVAARTCERAGASPPRLSEL
jgi:fructokinase